MISPVERCYKLIATKERVAILLNEDGLGIVISALASCDESQDKDVLDLLDGLEELMDFVFKE